MGEELGFSSTLLTNTYAIGCATLALGAPMLIPFALKFGSRPVYVISSAGQFAISMWAANTQTAGDWWGVNALQCWLGALAEVLIQMTIAEMYFVHQRGLMNAIYIWVANVGSNLAIVAAGFITRESYLHDSGHELTLKRGPGLAMGLVVVRNFLRDSATNVHLWIRRNEIHSC